MSTSTPPISCSTRTVNPPSAGRFRLVCPPTNYTFDELSMRRKAEILRYTKNAAGANTSSGQYSKAINGNSGIPLSNLQNLKRVNNVLLLDSSLCATANCSLNSSCDVPGPMTTLCFQSSVPLYNFKKVYTYNNADTSIQPG